MSERKVLTKYYPPTFDPSKIPRRKGVKNDQHKVRLMTPFSMRCNTCGDYIYKGKKFNARKETVVGETYYSIKIFRFYIRCPRCSAEITFKTDPKNLDYVAEHGAARNFEPWRDEEKSAEEKKAKRAKEEENNPMKALENRTVDSKKELDILDALDEIRTKNAKSEKVDVDSILEKMLNEEPVDVDESAIEEEYDRLAKEVFQSADGEIVRRIEEEDVDVYSLIHKNDNQSQPEVKTSVFTDFTAGPTSRKRKADALDIGIVKKPSNGRSNPTVSSSASSSSNSASNGNTQTQKNNGALTSLVGYGSDDSDDE